MHVGNMGRSDQQDIFSASGNLTERLAQQSYFPHSFHGQQQFGQVAYGPSPSGQFPVQFTEPAGKKGSGREAQCVAPPYLVPETGLYMRKRWRCRGSGGRHERGDASWAGLEAGTGTMPGNTVLPEQTGIKTVDFQFLFRPDGRVVPAALFISRFEIIAFLVPGQ